jgi:hypothetical protein
MWFWAFDKQMGLVEVGDFERASEEVSFRVYWVDNLDI